MKFLSSLVVLIAFSSYHMAESKPVAATNVDPVSLKAALKNLANGSDQVTKAIKEILGRILFGNDENVYSAEASLKVINDAAGLKANNDNGETGVATVAYIEALASTLTLAAQEAKKVTGEIAHKKLNGATHGIKTLAEEVNRADKAADVALSSKAVGGKQSAVTALNTLARNLVSAAETAIQIGQFDLEPEKYGEITDKVDIAGVFNKLAVAVKGAADVSRRALAVLES